MGPQDSSANHHPINAVSSVTVRAACSVYKQFIHYHILSGKWDCKFDLELLINISFYYEKM